MKIKFQIDYRTAWGESLYLTAPIPELGADDRTKAPRLSMTGGSIWTLELDVADTTTDFSYRYFVRHDNGAIREECGENPHSFRRARAARLYEIFDRWQDQPADKSYYSSAFVDSICRPAVTDRPLSPKNGIVNIRVAAPMISPGHAVAISGSIEALGCWDPQRAIVMNNARFPVWETNIDLKSLESPFEYKFLIIDRATGEPVAWEAIDNRSFTASPANRQEVMVVDGLRMAMPLAPWKGAGVAIPVFSVRTGTDFGVGDFEDLKLMVDWAVATGQKFLQILPINDTTMTGTWTDSYPYNANSTVALHPMYLRPELMGTLKESGRRKYYENLRCELNALPVVDYERVNRAKLDYARELFSQDGDKTLKSAEFRKFATENEHWLTPYAAFCVLRDRFSTADFHQWGEYSVYSQERIAEFVSKNERDVNFVRFLQFHLDRQLHSVRDYAHSRGIAFKGDIPIGISRTSVDAWTDPRLFNLDCQAGAPPDDFSVLGQNWGFPTYNWEEMSRDGFAWWKARLKKMAEYCDAFRIDHVLGFFRIWQIPMDAIHGLLGVFNPALPFMPDELRDNYGFHFNRDWHTRPYIMEYMLGDFFGEYTDEVRSTYLETDGFGRYRLRPEVATQRKVADTFAAMEKSEKNDRICNALMGLIDDVLFIEDPYEQGKYHPRIAAQFTYIYRSMSDYERQCFDRLYNDFFYHRHNDFWYGKAMWKLPVLVNATNMLVCAEDLGMIPACVPAVLDRLEILSLEIERMPKDPRTPFGNTWAYPYLSVCTTSTHDMGGIRLWWEEDRAATQRYFNEVLHEGGSAPYFAEPWVCDRIVTRHLQSPSMLAILPLQDWLSISGDLRRQDPRDEQINIPAISRHYWRYRMHLTVEQLLADTEFNTMLRDKIAASGR